MNETLLPAQHAPGLRGLLERAGRTALQATLTVSPRPMALVIRKRFAQGAAPRTAALLRHAPHDIVTTIDERYGRHRDALLDVYVPAAGARPGSRLPTVVWTHGGAFVGGSKEELAGYLRMIADAGFTVVAVRYTRAPEAHYPTPTRQLMTALRYLHANADRLHVDAEQLVLVGDSAGAHISAQVAALVTNADYARTLDIKAPIMPDQIRGVALCSGIYDFDVGRGSPLEDFFTAIGWAYSGKRDYRQDDRFLATTALANHVTADFPPAFLTAGNADPLAPQSAAFAAALRTKGVDVETLFFPDDHNPPLPHEYQFDLELYDGHFALERLVGFCRRRTVS